MFFFRDPAFIDDVPEPKRADFLPELAALSGEPTPTEKLATLKQTIRDTPLPFQPFDGYPCQYAGFRINWQLASRDLQDPADREALRQIAEDGIVTPDEYNTLDDHLRELVHRFGLVHLAGLEQFGQRVSDQLWQAIKTKHNLPDTPPTATLAETDPLAEEAAYHEDFIESRLRVYVGREKDQKDLLSFAESEMAFSYFIVTGRSGSGKSAALARFARSYAEAHPEVLVIPHFVGAGPDSTDLRQMLLRFCLLIRERFNQHFEQEKARRLSEVKEENRESEQQEQNVKRQRRAIEEEYEVPHEIEAIVNRFRQFCNTIPDDSRVLLVIDGLDRLDQADNAHSMWWLPKELPSHVRVVASCVNDASEGQEPTEPVLQAIALWPRHRLEIQPLTSDERFEVLSHVPSLSAKRLDRKQVDLLLSNPATKNPLFLLVALEELRGFGSYEQVADRIVAFPHDAADPIAALFAQVIERLRQEFDADVVRTTLTLIATSRSGISEPELLEMIEGMGAEQSTGDLYPILRQLRAYLQHRGELLDFSHRGMYEAIRERYLPEDGDFQPYHCELAEYFHAKLNPPDAEPWTGDYPRALSELPHHQTQGRLWHQLEATLQSLPFLEAKARAGWAFGLLDDFKTATEVLPDDRPQYRILQLLGEALQRDIHFIARHSSDYPQALFQCLWNTCWWYDSEEADAYYEAGRSPRSLSTESRKGDRGNSLHDKGCEVSGDCREERTLSQIMERWWKLREKSAGRFAWLRSLRPPRIHLGSAQKAIMRGHGRAVTSVSYSPDGRRIVSCARDGTIRVWDVATGEELSDLLAGPVNSAAFSPDGRQIWSGDDSGTLLAWDAMSGVQVDVMPRRLPAVPASPLQDKSVAYTPGSRRLAITLPNGTVRVMDAHTGDELVTLHGHSQIVLDVAYSSDDRRIVTGSRDKTVRVWDMASGAEVASLCGHDAAITSVAYSPDGRQVASGSDDKTVRIWDLASRAELAVLRGHDGAIESMAYSPDGRQIASGSNDKTVRVWDATGGTELAELREHDAAITNVAVSPDGCRIACGLVDNTVHVSDVSSGVELAIMRGHEREVYILIFRPDGRRIVTIDGFTMRVWDTASGTSLATWLAMDFIGGSAFVPTTAVYSPDGRRIAIGFHDGTVRVWDARTELGATLKSFIATRILAELSSGLGHPVVGVAYSPDGKRIVCLYEDGTTRTWDAVTGQCLKVIRDSDNAPLHFAKISSRLSSCLLTRGRRSFEDHAILSNETGNLVAHFPGPALSPLATHPDGRTWAGASANHLHILTLEGAPNSARKDIPNALSRT